MTLPKHHILPLMWAGLMLMGMAFIPKESIDPDKVRPISYQGSTVKTTYDIEEGFLGRYQGRKKGFLELRADGSGTYRYDALGMMATDGCEPWPIDLEWGFLLDDEGKVVRFDREYGHSYPVLFKSVGKTRFKACREEVVLDFLMVYRDGSIGVSSSDDWKIIRQ